MIARIKPAHSQFSALGRQIRKQCQEFNCQTCEPKQAKLLLNGISQLLEFLPLASDEFGGALLRLRNAYRYIESAEFGAARYELRLLEGVLRPILGPETPDFVAEEGEGTLTTLVTQGMPAIDSL